MRSRLRLTMKEVTDFLNALFNRTEGYIEIRAIDKERKIRCFFFSTGLIEDLITKIFNKVDFLNRYNLYFGVCPRSVTAGKENDIKQVLTLWVDVDCKSEEEKKSRINKLNKFKYPPSIIIDSGHGLHAYWLLDQPFFVEDEKKKNKVKGILKGLSIYLNADKCFDLARILRIPNTFNLKDPANPIPVKILQIDPDKKYDLAKFEEFKAEINSSDKSDIELTQVETPERFYEILDKDEKLKNTWKGRRPDLNDQSRSGYDMSLADQLMSYGFSNSEIAAILKESPSGKGKESKIAYLKHTIRKARDAYKKIIKNQSKLPNEIDELISKSLTLGELLEKDLPQEDYIIENGILPNNGYLLLAGLTKEGKTILSLQIAFNLISGTPFLNRYQIKKKNKVLYLFAENTLNGLKNILKKQKTGLENNGIGLNMIEDNLILQEAKGLIIDTKENEDQLEKLIEYHKPKVVILDPISLFTSKDLNKLERVTHLIRKLNDIAKRQDCTWILIHHYRKPQRDDIDESIYKVVGSSGFANYCESFIGIQRAHRQRSSNYKKIDIVLRREESPEPIYLFRNSKTLLYELATKEEVSQSGVKMGDIIDILKNEFGKKATFTDIVKKGEERLGVSKTRIKDLLLAAEKEGLVVKGEGKFGKWSIKE